jgi:hypothetical protein
MMEALYSSGISVLTRATRRHMPEDGIFLLYLFAMRVTGPVLSLGSAKITRDYQLHTNHYPAVCGTDWLRT